MTIRRRYVDISSTITTGMTRSKKANEKKNESAIRLQSAIQH